LGAPLWDATVSLTLNQNLCKSSRAERCLGVCE
jgi:hypothetical protein